MDGWTGRHASRRCDREAPAISRSTTPSSDPGLQPPDQYVAEVSHAKRTEVDVRKVAQQPESSKDSQDLIRPWLGMYVQ